MTHRPPVPPPVQPPPPPPTFRQAQAPRAKRHWAKTGMLIVTIGWPCLAIWMGAALYFISGSQYKEAGHNIYLGPDQAVVTADQLESMQMLAAIGGAELATLLYAVAMVLLLVIWFATKDDRATP